MQDSSDPLDSLLHEWSASTESDPRLPSEVWRRIALEETAREPAGWLARVESWFASPAFSTVFVVSCVLLGLFLAELRVADLQNERSSHLVESYLRMIDPLLLDHNKGIQQ